MTVGLLGGTGPEGRGLAMRWARAGFHVIVGSRSSDRAETTAAELSRLAGRQIAGAENKYAVAQSEIVLLTIPFEHAASTIEAHRGGIRPGSILIDTTVPVKFEGGRPRYLDLPEGSGSEHLRARLDSKVDLVACFKTTPAHLLEEINEPLDCDEFVASDSEAAKSRVIEAVQHIAGLRPVDAGPLESARILERMTLLAIGINRRYKIKTGRFRVVGL